MVVIYDLLFHRLLELTGGSAEWARTASRSRAAPGSRAGKGGACMAEQRVWLVRHGETEWSKSGQHTGRTDIALTPNGERQAKALGRHLAGRKFALVLTSPMARAQATLPEQFAVMRPFRREISMVGRISVAVLAALIWAQIPARALAQDVPGIEICTVEKTMERRTSCLQSNVDFLQRTITKFRADHEQKLDAVNRQIEGLKGAVAGLQKTLDELQAAQKKVPEDRKDKADAPPAKDSAK